MTTEGYLPKTVFMALSGERFDHGDPCDLQRGQYCIAKYTYMQAECHPCLKTYKASDRHKARNGARSDE